MGRETANGAPSGAPFFWLGCPPGAVKGKAQCGDDCEPATQALTRRPVPYVRSTQRMRRLPEQCRGLLVHVHADRCGRCGALACRRKGVAVHVRAMRTESAASLCTDRPARGPGQRAFDAGSPG